MMFSARQPGAIPVFFSPFALVVFLAAGSNVGCRGPAMTEYESKLFHQFKPEMAKSQAEKLLQGDGELHSLDCSIMWLSKDHRYLLFLTFDYLSADGDPVLVGKNLIDSQPPGDRRWSWWRLSQYIPKPKPNRVRDPNMIARTWPTS